eukprot:TRINITY_DN1403_c0_g1_i3.p1 TRINITY_DN1403_c0_g1~~TRINITY_DN1403_c0_g1_i3.p1  ORF type:complete len:1207 (+),score=283.05 TRINITY_DN1403_c0_g1_i3:574-4194(+)
MVNTNGGVAYVIGVKDKALWFHIEGQNGASYWKDCMHAGAFARKGILPIYPSIRLACSQSGVLPKKESIFAVNIKQWITDVRGDSDACSKFGVVRGSWVDIMGNEAIVRGIHEDSIVVVHGETFDAAKLGPCRNREDVAKLKIYHPLPLSSSGRGDVDLIRFSELGEKLLATPKDLLDTSDGKTLLYMTRQGNFEEFDVSDSALSAHGLQCGLIVQTRKGPAVVIGVHNENVWFHIDGDTGASFWSELPRRIREREIVVQTEEKPVSLFKSHVYYQKRDKTPICIDTTPSACKRFGFFSGDYVSTPKGNAFVLGVALMKLWFHVDGDDGGSFWRHQSKEEFVGFKVIKSASSKESIVSKFMYPKIDGTMGVFDNAPITCDQFGFRHGQRVDTPRGPATIIGVCDKELYFHADIDMGATCIPGCTTAKLLQENEVRPISVDCIAVPPPSQNDVAYPLRNGDIGFAVTSDEACLKFGFLSGTRVMTPRGPSTVIGVSDGNVMFHCDADPGMSFWKSRKTPSDFAGFIRLCNVPRTIFVPDKDTGVMVVSKKSWDLQGHEIILNTTFSACMRFGYLPGFPVWTPSGEGVVAGVFLETLWFELVFYPGRVCCWRDCRSYEDLFAAGIRPKDGVPISPWMARSKLTKKKKIPVKPVEGPKKMCTYEVEDGSSKMFETGIESIAPFGFRHGHRVLTPRGVATVIGVLNEDLYFHVDKDSFASCWGGYGESEFKRLGFSISPYDSVSPCMSSKTVLESISGFDNSFDATFVSCVQFGVHAHEKVEVNGNKGSILGVKDDQIWWKEEKTGLLEPLPGSTRTELMQNGVRREGGGCLLGRFLNPPPGAPESESERFLCDDVIQRVILVNDVSCEPFGFYSGHEVGTPFGPCTVVGCCDGHLWYRKVGSSTITPLKSAKSYKGALKAGLILRSFDRNLAAVFHKKPSLAVSELPPGLTGRVIDFSCVAEGRIIGAGSFGTVCHCEVYGSILAMKKLDVSKMDGSMSLFWEEVELLSKCSHDNVVPLRFVSLAPPCLFTSVMDGGSVDRRLFGPIKVPESKRLQWLEQVAVAMRYLHLHTKIAHLDLKCQNLLLDRNDVLHVSDFGISRHISKMTGDGRVKGTPVYMAPEAWEGHPSMASDVYSFGIIMWEFHTGQPHRIECGLDEMSSKVASGHRPDASVVHPDWYRELMESCWNTNPSNRPSFEEIHNTLRAHKE